MKQHRVVASGGFAGAVVRDTNPVVMANGEAPGGEESGGEGRRLVAFGSLKALSGETLDACLERHSALAGRGAPRLALNG